MTTIRKMKEAQIDYSLLSLEAKQVAHFRYSQMVLDAVQTNQACMKGLMAMLEGERSFDPVMHHALLKGFLMTYRVIEEAVKVGVEMNACYARREEAEKGRRLYAKIEAQMLKQMMRMTGTTAEASEGAA